MISWASTADGTYAHLPRRDSPREVRESLVITTASFAALTAPAVLLATATSVQEQVALEVLVRMLVNLASLAAVVVTLYVVRRRFGVPVRLLRVGAEVTAAGLLVVLLRQSGYAALDLSQIFLNNHPATLQWAVLTTVPITVITAVSETWLARRLLSETELRIAAYHALDVEERQVRERLFDELHGTLQTELVLAATSARRLSELTDDDTVRRGATRLHDDLQRVRVEQLRALAHSLQPALIEAGLVPALRVLVGRTEAAGHEVAFDVDHRALSLASTLDRGARLALYRVAEEGISNALQHSESPALRLVLTQGQNGLELAIEDDGHASDPTARDGGHGIRVLRARLQPYGGDVHLRRTALGSQLVAHLAVPRRAT